MKKFLLILSAVLCVSASWSQGFKDVKINEILVKNIDSYADDHAHKVGWIELFNSGYSNVNIAGTFIRLIQGGDTTTYRIPKSDARTLMSPQGYLIFFADSSSNKGTFHTNFRLDVYDSVKWASLIGFNDRLELLDQSGRVIVDSMEYDVNTQQPDVSFGRIKDENGEIVIRALTHITPLQNNETIEPTPKGELFRMQDPAGITMALIAMTVVFIALVLLYLVFRTLGKYMHSGTMKKEAKAVKAAARDNEPAVAFDMNSDEPTGETIAAIAVALRFFEDDMHDMESQVITINRVAKAYSPWSSKIYSLRQIPNKK